MNIVHINVSDIKGGAAIAAYRLHQGLKEQGVHSTMVVAEKYSQDGDVTRPLPDRIGYYGRRLHYRQLGARFWRSMPARPPGLSPFTHPQTGRSRRLIQALPQAEIINLHWIASYVDLPSFLAQAQVPLVWTLHDMNAFTGGCHYALDCDRFQEQCGACPQLGSKSERDVSRTIWQIKRDMFQGLAPGSLQLVAPSRWLAEEVRRSSLLRDLPLAVIPNALPTAVFRPYEKTAARERLGIPAAAKVVLFSADAVTSRRKGLPYLMEALSEMDVAANILLVTLGAGRLALDPRLPLISLGHLADEQQIALAYSAADLFVIPSLQDNLPNTVLEAMACGTPVVGFDVGGIGEMVRPGTTGQLVPARDVRQLRQAIAALLADELLRAGMAANCRQIALTEYSLPVQAERYVALYQRLRRR